MPRPSPHAERCFDASVCCPSAQLSRCVGGGANATATSASWTEDNPCFTLGALIAYLCGSIGALCMGASCFCICSRLKRHGNDPASLIESFKIVGLVAKPTSVANNNEPPLQERLRRKTGYICVGGCIALFAGILLIVLLAVDPLRLFSSTGVG